MEELKTKEVCYKSDFSIIESCDTGYSLPFQFGYYTDRPARKFVVMYDGNEYFNCQPNDDGTLTVCFDDHRLGLGRLMVERRYYRARSDFETGVADVVLPAQPVVLIDKDKPEGERLMYLDLALQGVATIDAYSVMEPYWMYDGFGKAAMAAEVARAETEKGRVDAEAARVQAEASRIQVEKARVTAEASRVEVEQTRVKAEQVRTSAEQGRVQAEAKRVAAEQARVDAESARASAEAARVQAEKTRASAEAARVDAEKARAQAEQGRVDAEKARVDVEASRVQVEAARVKAENARAEEFAEAKSAAEDATAKCVDINSHPITLGSNGTWWRWDADKQEYVDTSTVGYGGIMMPTFVRRRNKLIAQDYGDGFSSRVGMRRNHLYLRLCGVQRS